MQQHENSRIDDLLDEWELALGRGEHLSIDVLCRECPELRSQVQAKVDALAILDPYLSEQTQAYPTTPSEDTLRVSSEITGLKFHAKGGLGAVYRATETGLNRQVAIKFIHPSLVEVDECRNRFSLEAEVTGGLEHPGVVPLYGMGEAENGRMFYYMRYIDGETLEEAIRRFHQNRSARGGFADESVEFRQLLTRFVAVCKTIAYAHNRGIVHRDIKPANVMLGRYGETVVVDWGLAAPVARDARFVASGELSLRPVSGNRGGVSSSSGAGTLAYMSPEQASNLAPTPASDIYTLGATLYKILTGEPSVCGEDVTELKRQIVDGDICRPRERLSSVPSALEAICLHAMALLPKERYQTALEFAADVENYLADAKVTVFDDPWSRRVARWARKHRLAAQTAILGLIGVLAVSALASIWLAQLASSARRSEHEANKHKLLAEQSRDEAYLARRENLQLSAKFFAESLADKIDKRWRVMESVRTSPRLTEFLSEIRQAPGDERPRRELQAWLGERKELNDVFRTRDRAQSIWCVFAENGELLARVPRAKSIAQRFPHRDYFHGAGRDLVNGDPELDGRDVARLKPFDFVLGRLQDHEQGQAAHVSAVYVSTATKTLMVSFTVPIWDAPAENMKRKPIGVFSIANQLQDFDLPPNAMIFQVTADQLEGKPGLVISHPLLKPLEEGDRPPRITSIIKEATQLTNYRQRFPNDNSTVNSLVTDFVDPVIESYEGRRTQSIAAFEPVIVRSRPESIAGTGWVVVVKETGSPRW